MTVSDSGHVPSGDRVQTLGRLLARLPARAVVAALILTAYGASAWLLGSGIVDDSYIFLRYARNILRGHGPVFNPDEPVEGFTSPLWLAVATLISAPSSDPPVAIVWASALSGALLLLALVRSANGPLPGAVGALYLATNPGFVFWSWSGMDAVLFAILLLVVVVNLEEDRERGRGYKATGLALSIASLARMEALWLLPLILVVAMVEPKRATLRQLTSLVAPSLVVHGLLLIGRLAFYGEWLPNTYQVKVGVPQTVLLNHGIEYVAGAIARLSPALLVTLSLSTFIAASRRSALTIPAAAAGWWLVYVLLVGGDHFAHDRFVLPVFVLCGLLLSRTAGLALSSHNGRHLQAPVILLVIVLVNLPAWLSADVEKGRSEVRMARAWAKTGRWCATELAPGTLATLVVGAIPYYCDRPVIDLVGLVDRTIARAGHIVPDAAVGHQKFATEYVLSREPRYVIFTISGQAPVPRLASPTDWEKYLPRDTNYAMLDLLRHPETSRYYTYRVEPLGDGTWVEFLERRAYQ